MTSSFGLDEVLRRSLDTFIEETSVDAAEVWLVEESTLILTMHRGHDPEAFGSVDRLELGEGLPGRAATGRDPIVVHDLPADDRFVRPEVVEAGYVTFCAIPLWYRGRLVGVMAAAARDAGAMTAAWELRLLGAVGEWLALAVEHARLHRQVQDDAVLQEREWIARELHDGLGQVVGNIIARMLTVKKLLADGRLDELREELDAIEGISRAVYADVREAMLGLRTTPRTEDGLVEAVRTFAVCFTDATGIATTVVAPAPDAHVHVSPDVEIQVVRILQEALSNVRKHSGASAVRVIVDHDGPFLRTAVIDDGHGFDPARRRHRAGRGSASRPCRSERHRSAESSASRVSRGRAPASWCGCPWALAGTRRTPTDGPDPLMRVLLVDDHAVFRAGLTSLLTAWGFDVVGQAGDGDTAIELAGRLQPDVVFMDVSMPGRNGLETTRAIRASWPAIRIVMLSASDTDPEVLEAIRSGAEGYLRKDLQEEPFTRLVEAIKRGEPAMSPELARRLLDAFARSHDVPPEPGPDQLTERELQVLARLPNGATNRAIASTLGISERTVGFHVHNLLTKLGLHNRAEAIAWAIEHGVREPD